MAFKKIFFSRTPIRSERFAHSSKDLGSAAVLTTTTKESWKSQGSGPVGRDLCALKALTPLPRLWLRSPAPGSPTSKATRGSAAEPGRQARAHAVSSSPAARGGRGIRPGACRRRPHRPVPRPPGAARARPLPPRCGLGRGRCRPADARGPARRAQACGGLARPAPPKARASPGRGRMGPGLLRGGRAAAARR